MIGFWIYVCLSFFIAQGQSQSGGHGPGGGKKDDKVSNKQDLIEPWKLP